MQELVAILEVPAGTTIGSTILYGEDTSVTFSVYSVDLTTGTPTLLGSGTVGTSLDHTDYTASLTDYLVLIVDVASTTADTIYGGVLSDATATQVQRVSPAAFLANDD